MKIIHHVHHSSALISMLRPTSRHDAHFLVIRWKFRLFKRVFVDNFQSHFNIDSNTHSYYPLRFYKIITKMADNLRRTIQDIDLGVNDDPIPLPIEVVAQAAAENQFILFGRSVMPRRQNLRSIVATLPRTWGQDGIVHGRVIEGVPWAFNDRMLIIQRWTPHMNPPLINFIPF